MTPGEKASPSTVIARDRPGGGGITLPETDVGVAREEIVWRASSELMTSELAAAELMTSELAASELATSELAASSCATSAESSAAFAVSETAAASSIVSEGA